MNRPTYRDARSIAFDTETNHKHTENTPQYNVGLQTIAEANALRESFMESWPSFKSYFEWLSVTGAAREARRARRHRIRAARRARINRRGWA